MSDQPNIAVIYGTAPLLPVGALQRRSLGWSGIQMAITTEAALFVFLLFCYYYYDVQLADQWRPAELPKLRLAFPNTIILGLSSAAVWIAEHRIRRNARVMTLISLAVAILLGAAFAGIQILEWADKPFTMRSSLYGSVYFTVTGFHMAHVVVGLIGLILVWLWVAMGYFDARRHAGLLIASIYWHFVDAVWLFVFFSFYIYPRFW